MPRSTTTTELRSWRGPCQVRAGEPDKARPTAEGPSRRRFLHVASTTIGVALLSRIPIRAQQAARITIVDLGGAMLLQGAGGNVLALGGPDGALMIDGGLAANAEALLSAVKRATGTNRINTLINTHWHPEQTGANELVGKAGGVIFAH